MAKQNTTTRRKRTSLTAHLTFRDTQETKEVIEQIADNSGLDCSDVLRMIVARGLRSVKGRKISL